MRINLRSKEKTRIANSMYPARYFVSTQSIWDGEEWIPTIDVYRTSRVFTPNDAWEYNPEAGEYFTNDLPQLDGITFINYSI